MLVLRVLKTQPLHGYAIAQRIHLLSANELRVEEGSLYPALQRMLKAGWLSAQWGQSERGRQVRIYKLTPAGRKQLEHKVSAFERLFAGIMKVMRASES